jgi:hypothetical protein
MVAAAIGSLLGAAVNTIFYFFPPKATVALEAGDNKFFSETGFPGSKN